MASPPPDYYKTLEVDPRATQQEIRDAYKKAALKHHPDRVATDSPERPKRTKKFQEINDAYFTLSDPTRRRDYDTARTYHASSYSSAAADDDADETFNAGAGGARQGFSFPWSAFGFGQSSEAQEEQFRNEQFGSVFEEMMREEGMAEDDEASGQRARPTGKFWGIVGGVSGGAMGFILANAPGALAGAVAGNRLGAIRDAKGKSVYSVFKELPQADRARLLSELAAKVFAHAVSG